MHAFPECNASVSGTRTGSPEERESPREGTRQREDSARHFHDTVLQDGRSVGREKKIVENYNIYNRKL